jgi:hypothetical protein
MMEERMNFQTNRKKITEQKKKGNGERELFI